MPLYPTLEDMKIDNMVQAQLAQPAPPAYYNSVALPSVERQANRPVYPSLGQYMGLELSSDVIALNMPEYQIQQQMQPRSNVDQLIAPISSQSTTIQKATVTQAIRQLIVCKDADGKVGLRFHAVNSGIFVCYVAAGSPAALAGLRFGDQVLEINNVSLAGMTMEKCHEMLRKAPINGIVMAVRDRPFERTITLHKDSHGHVGFQFKDGKVTGLVKDSSAARNGLLTEHQILEVNTVHVVGMKDKEIANIIEASPPIVNITIIPHAIYKHMISKMSTSLFKELDRTPAV